MSANGPIPLDWYGRLLAQVLFPAYEAVRRRPTVALLDRLERTQWLPLDALRSIQVRYLRV